MSQPTSYFSPTDLARERVNVPGLLLFYVGLLNLLGAFFWYYLAFEALCTDPQHATKKMLEVFPKWKMEKPITAEDLRRGAYWYLGLGTAILVSSYVTLVGGLRMRKMQSYSLALTGAVLASLPVLSCTGCCLLGQIAGLWAVVVLRSPAVYLVFQGLPTSTLVPSPANPEAAVTPAPPARPGASPTPPG